MFSPEEIESHLHIKFTQNEKKYFLDTKLNKYVLPSSNKQISTLLRFKNPHTYFRLCILLSKFKKTHNFDRVIYQLLLNNNCKDTEIYAEIFKFMNNQPAPRIMYNNTPKNYVADILINLNLKPTSLLDIGCGNGIITREFGLALGISKQKIIGMDVPNEFELNWNNTRPSDIQFINIINNNLCESLTSAYKFDMISCFMVLHHLSNEILNNYLLDIHKLLTPNGLFVVKEHDCFNAIDYMIVDIEHSLYIAKEAVLQLNETTLSEATKKRIFEQKINYRDRYSWRILIEKKGFRLIHESICDPSLSNSYAPNRAYLAIFKRV